MRFVWAPQAMTTTVNTGFGSHVMSQSTGPLATRICRSSVAPEGTPLGFDQRRTSLSHVRACSPCIVRLSSHLNVSCGAGLLLNNEMDDFSTPGQPNVYNLPPAKANFIRPGACGASDTGSPTAHMSVAFSQRCCPLILATAARAAMTVQAFCCAPHPRGAVPLCH